MRKRTIGLLTAVVAMTIAGFLGIAVASTATCANPATLGSGATGSAFEIDTDANLIVNTSGCTDWLTGGTGSSFNSGVIWRFDDASGSDDYSFGQGTAEDDPNPTDVQGSIPPNKSDLKAFGVFTEQNPPTPPNGYVELFWSRVQDPKGTTNMDFELNKNKCVIDPQTGEPTSDSLCADNGDLGAADEVRTPVRSDGDALISYDLSKGGTVPTISIRFWDDAAQEWGQPDVIVVARTHLPWGRSTGIHSELQNAGGQVSGLTVPG